MCKKERYEKHRNVFVSFFAFAMLVIPNYQKLSLGTRSICLEAFLARRKGLEPPTYWFVASHSIQLSYKHTSFTTLILYHEYSELSIKIRRKRHIAL